jgi:hypothetical protein
VCRSSSNISVFIKELTFKIRTGEFRKKSFWKVCRVCWGKSSLSLIP